MCVCNFLSIRKLIFILYLGAFCLLISAYVHFMNVSFFAYECTFVDDYIYIYISVRALSCISTQLYPMAIHRNTRIRGYVPKLNVILAIRLWLRELVSLM